MELPLPLELPPELATTRGGCDEQRPWSSRLPTMKTVSRS
jgi:hypothetical protein